jgi:hypothetical protein
VAISRLNHINLSYNDLFLFKGSWPGDKTSRSNNAAISKKGAPALIAATVCADHINAIDVCGCHVDIGRDRVFWGHDTWNQDPTSGIANNVGPLQGENSGHFRMPTVVTDHDSNPTERQMKDGDAQVPPLKKELLFIPEMDLTILTYKAVGANEGGAIV